MHEPKASALRSRDRYCIARVRHSKTRKASSVCYNDFSAVTDLQPTELDKVSNKFLVSVHYAS